MKQGRETTQEERIEIEKTCIASGKNYGEIALKYQVSYQPARSWTLRFEKEGESGLEDRRGKRSITTTTVGYSEIWAFCHPWKSTGNSCSLHK